MISSHTCLGLFADLVVDIAEGPGHNLEAIAAAIVLHPLLHLQDHHLVFRRQHEQTI